MAGSRGVDVSSHQPPDRVPWSDLGIDFMYARAGIGRGVDEAFGPHMLRARDAGVRLRGAYWALRPSRSIEAQVDLLDRSMDGVGGDCFPVLDVELIDGMTTRQVAAAALEFVERIESRRGLRCVVYSYVSFLKALPLDPSLALRPLIIARYGGGPIVPAPWTSYVVHQFDGDGGLRAPNGLDLDWNRSDLTPEQLRAELLRHIEPS